MAIKTWAAISGQPTRALPHTWRVRTGGGGEHIIFQNTLGIKGGDLDRGIEIKAKGGYIVGVGCKHVSGPASTSGSRSALRKKRR